MENIYNWQYNTIPGNANQGAVLMTRNNITQPPFNQTDFIWKAMEDVIGTADVKLEYDEVENLYKLYKAKGHMDNEGNWTYDWEFVGDWAALTEEVVDILRELTYVEYVYDTSIANTLKVYGIRKDGTRSLLCDIRFATTQYVDQAIAGLKKNKAGNAINLTDVVDQGETKQQISVLYNSDYFTINNYNEIDITNFLKQRMRYRGIITTIANAPSDTVYGDVFYVSAEFGYEMNVGVNTPVWQELFKVNETFDAQAVQLQKTMNGLYAKLKYDDVDFIIDNLHNLKSQIIDDTKDASDPLANRKTYSINKILDLISGMFNYKGQVNYYDQLPTTGNVKGDCWNVVYAGTSTEASTELNGDNYAWNGTTWDDLSGEYRAGAGIVINGKTISATGISFIIGDGLMATGSGSNTTLSTRISDGLEYKNVGTEDNPINALSAKLDQGLEIHTGAIRTKIGHGMMFDANNALKVKAGDTINVDANGVNVKPHNGLVNSTDGLDINANFNIKSTPLGTDSSKLAIYSDGKIAVDFTESPVVISGELLHEWSNSGNNQHTIGQIAKLADYDMIYFAIYQDTSATNLMGSAFIFKDSITNIYRFTQIAPRSVSPSIIGAYAEMAYCTGNDIANNILGTITWYYVDITGITTTTNWTIRSNGWSGKIYGLKAR